MYTVLIADEENIVTRVFFFYIVYILLFFIYLYSSTIIYSGLSEEEATQLILYWQARQLSVLRASLGLPGRYLIDNATPGPWPRLVFIPHAIFPPLPEPPPMAPPLYVYEGE